MTVSVDTLSASRAQPSRQGGTSLRPQLLRPSWADLSGTWRYASDDDDTGRARGWQRGFDGGQEIQVPFPPESPSSGINDPAFHPVIWYQYDVTRTDLGASGWGEQGDRLLLHFGAVDYRCEVWLNGQSLGQHEGGHVPFSFDATDVLDRNHETQLLVVRVEDDPFDVAQPRGKQDWQENPHVVWYHRTTGIWQPVWLESVPRVSVKSLAWSSDLPSATVSLHVELSRQPDPETTLEVVLSHEGQQLARQQFDVSNSRFDTVLTLPRQTNGQDYENLLWSPAAPRLIDAYITLDSPKSTDSVGSYLGLRSVGVAGGRFMLNDRPCYLRAVLSQGYWPESHLAAPSADALRAEVELILSLGFNAARVHQKIEDPRFLYWADRLGLMLWEEMPSAFESSTTATQRVVNEWMGAVSRDRSHPSVIVWVPLNESWGVQHIAHEPAVAAYARALADLTRALDPSRPVISNDGWEHVNSDIISIHDYEGDGQVLATRYASIESLGRLIAGVGPAGRRTTLSPEWDEQPVMLTEFGGIKFEADVRTPDAWGYTAASTPSEFAERLDSVLRAVSSSPVLAGWCYTQLTDTLQEKNGILTENRALKLPLEQVRDMIEG